MALTLFIPPMLLILLLTHSSPLTFSRTSAAAEDVIARPEAPMTDKSPDRRKPDGQEGRIGVHPSKRVTGEEAEIQIIFSRDLTYMGLADNGWGRGSDSWKMDEWPGLLHFYDVRIPIRTGLIHRASAETRIDHSQRTKRRCWIEFAIFTVSSRAQSLGRSAGASRHKTIVLE